jgi:hypothetical protein
VVAAYLVVAPVTETPKLNAALAALQGELPSVRKDKTAKVKSERTGSEYTYPYADLADIAEVIHPLMSKHGLAFAAAPHFRDDGKYVLVGELLHVSGESKDGEFPLPIAKPQEIGSAYTYGRRYLLCGLTGVVADQDDDGAAAQRVAAPKPKPQQRQRPKPADEPEPAVDHVSAEPFAARIAATDKTEDLGALLSELAVANLSGRDRALLRTQIQDKLRAVS